MSIKKVTRADARQTAADETYSLDELVNPEDIDSTADCWDDVDDRMLEQEAAYSSDVMMSENQSPFDHLEYDLTISLTRKALKRVSMDHLDYDNPEIAVQNGFWPNGMDYHWITEQISEYVHDKTSRGNSLHITQNGDKLTHIWNESLDEARQTVSAGIHDGLTDIDSKE
jgi:hypothetical protein